MNPSALTVDTSVFASATLQHEDHHKEARAFMRMLDVQQVETFVPALLLPEIMSALQRNRYPLARIRQLVLAYRAARMTIVPVDVRLSEEAGEIAILNGTKGSDSVFLALAREWSLPLVTLDREQLDRAPADVEVFTPEEALAKWWPA